MEQKKYLKLGDMDGQTFTVTKAWGYQWKKYDEVSRRMLVSESYEQGYQKRYGIDTSDGKLEVSEPQLKSMLSSVYKDGVSNINGATFKVKKVVGQNGIPNYYFNPVKKEVAKEDTVHPFEDSEPADLSEIPF